MMFFFKKNKKYILIVILVLIFILLVGLVIYLFPSLSQNLPPLPSSPVSIKQSNKIYDYSSKHSCQVTPFSQTFNSEQIAFQVDLNPSYKDSIYKLELGALPLGVEGNINPISGKGKMSVNLYLNNITKETEGSFTIPLAYHEYQVGKFKWLTNYCLFNVIFPMKE